MNRLFLVTAVLALLVSGGMTQADQFWGSASAPWGGAGPSNVPIGHSHWNGRDNLRVPDWSWIMAATSAPGNILYAVHNDIGNLYNFKLAKVNATTGAVLSDTPIASFSATDYPQWNALEYYDGKIYAVENSTADAYNATAYPDWTGTANANRGHVYEVGLDGSGDPISVTLGAYIGGYPAPDGALAYKDGVWYASDWNTNHSSWIKTTTDVMNINFTASVGTSPVGLFDGWDFEADGDMLGVSWWADTGTASDDFNVYKIDPLTGSATALFNIKSQLPSNIESLSGLSAAAPVPEPMSIFLGIMGLGSIAGFRRFRK